jgi:hypothetical protein
MSARRDRGIPQWSAAYPQAYPLLLDLAGENFDELR